MKLLCVMLKVSNTDQQSSVSQANAYRKLHRVKIYSLTGPHITLALLTTKSMKQHQYHVLLSRDINSPEVYNNYCFAHYVCLHSKLYHPSVHDKIYGVFMLFF